MQIIVYLLCHCRTYSGNFLQFLYIGIFHLPSAAKMAQQIAPPFGAHAGYTLQCRLLPRLVSAGTVPGDGKTVRFISNMLYQVQGRIVPGKLQLFTRIAKYQRLEARFSRHTFGDANYLYARYL